MAKWAKIIGWTAVTIGALLLLTIFGIAVLLKTQAFHRYLLAKIEQVASQKTGAQVDVENLQIHVKTLTADLYGLTVHGSEADTEKPLLQVQHLKVGVRITSIFHLKVNLSELIIERPVVNLLVNKEGHSNLPQPPPSQSKNSSTNVFDLAVGHVLLTNGEIDAKDRAIPVNANLANLRTEINFNQTRRQYSGTISYANGLIQYERLRPLPHSMRTSFDIDPSELNVKPLQLTLGGSRIKLQATVHDYAGNPAAKGNYNVTLHTQDFSGLSPAGSAAGDVTLRGELSYTDVPGQSVLRSVALSGDIDSSGLDVFSSQARIRIDRLAGRYQLANGNFKADTLVAELLGGRLTASGTIEQIETSRRSRLHADLSSISLQALTASLRNLSPQSVPVTGTLNATADAHWHGGFTGLQASSQLRMRGALVPTSAARSQHFPLTGDLRATYDGPRNLLTVTSSSIQLPATSIHAQGQVGNNSKLTITATSTDLHQLMLLASAMRGPTQGSNASTSSNLADIHGAANLNAVVRGTVQNPQVTADLSATGLEVNQSEWKSIQISLAASPSQFAIRHASIVSAQKGQLNLSARAALKHWSYVPANPVMANLQIERLQIAELQQAANLKYPVEGEISGNVQLSGSELSPQGQGKIQISKAKVSDEPLKTVSANFQAANGTIHSNLVLQELTADVSFTPKTRAYDLKLNSSPIDLSKSHTVQAKNLPLKGLVTLTATGAGTLDNPQLAASIEADQLQMRETKFSRVQAKLDVANHLAKLALNSGVGGAAVHGNATVHLSPGYYTEASLDTSKFAFDPFIAMYMPSRPADLHGETELHLAVKGPASDMHKLEAHLTIPVLDASFQSIQFGATGPIRADYANSVLVLQPASIKGTDTSLQFQGRIPINQPGEIAVSAHGSVGLQLAEMFSPGLRTGGNIAIDVNAGGTFKSPDISGQVRLQKVSFSSEDLPIGMQDLNADMQITNKSIQITRGTGKLGGGDLTLGGSIIYRPQLAMNVAVSAKSVRIRYPEGVRTVFDSDLTLSGDQKASLLQGRVLIDSLSFTSDFDVTTFMSQFTGNSTPGTGKGMADNLKLQIAVQSTSQLSAGTSQLGIEGSANLRVVNTAADPVIVGRADLTSGDIFFHKNQYHLERGTITFANPNHTTPVLNVLITTTINQYNLSISIRGPIEKLQTTYISDPTLPPVDIISLIARGQTTMESQGSSFGTDQVLAAGLGQVGGEVTKLTGISGLQIDPLIGGENTNPSARIGIQKRVTKNFTFTFSTDVTQPQSEIVQGEYQINKRWSVSVTRDQNGGFGIDGKFHTKF